MEANGTAGVAVDSALAALLDRYPQAGVCAVGADGLCVAMPPSVPLGAHRVVTARSPVDLVVAADRVDLVNAWERTRSSGELGQSVVVHLLSDPARAVTLHLLDVRVGHGVVLGVFVPAEAEAETDGDDDLWPPEAGDGGSPVTPRVAQVRQNDVGVFVRVDEAICRILGWAADDLVGRLSLDFIHPDDHERAINNWMDMLATRGPVSRVRLRHRHRDGGWVWMEITNHNLLELPAYGYVVADMINITDEMAATEALRAREQLLDRLAEALPVGVVQIDAGGNVVYTNNRLHAVLGVPRAATVEAQMASVAAGDRAVLAEAFAAVLAQGRDADLEVRLGSPAAGGSRADRRCTVSLRALTTAGGEVTGAIVCVTDVTESARLRDELRVRATVDDVTGCANRPATMAALDAFMSTSDGGGRPAVIFVDLDRFKNVNDTLGHAAGDELLRVVARRLHRAVRADDVVGRLGGDEFLVLRGAVASADEAVDAAERLARIFQHQIRLEAGRLRCVASIGVAWSADGSIGAEELVAMADSAMYEAKRAGDSRVVLRQTPVARERQRT